MKSVDTNNSGRSRGGPPPPRLTFLDQTEGREIFLRPPQGLDDRPPPPPYLKVRIHP